MYGQSITFKVSTYPYAVLRTPSCIQRSPQGCVNAIPTPIGLFIVGAPIPKWGIRQTISNTSNDAIVGILISLLVSALAWSVGKPTTHPSPTNPNFNSISNPDLTLPSRSNFRPGWQSKLSGSSRGNQQSATTPCVRWRWSTTP